LGETAFASVPIGNFTRGCLTGESGARFDLPAATRAAITAFLARAREEIHPSPFAARQRQLQRAGCMRCHARDTDQPAPLEEIGRALWVSFHARFPFQRTPPLTHALSKYTRAHLLNSLRDGVSGVRPEWYSYRMPAYGAAAQELLRALAEGDGDFFDTDTTTPPSTSPDPTLHTLGPSLVGFEGYGSVACHLWK